MNGKLESKVGFQYFNSTGHSRDGKILGRDKEVAGDPPHPTGENRDVLSKTDNEKGKGNFRVIRSVVSAVHGAITQTYQKFSPFTRKYTSHIAGMISVPF